MKKLLCTVLALAMVFALAACGGGSDVEPVDPETCTFDEMVAYLTAKGYITEGAEGVDMLTTAGYLTDNTGGSLPTAPFADRAADYDGLWLMWWDVAGESEAYQGVYVNMAANAGNIVYQGGAATLATSALNGPFAIAFAEGFADADAVLADFEALGAE